jgi:hypothetical protein
MMGTFSFSGAGAAFTRHMPVHLEIHMKSSILRASGIALACALGLSACGGGSGDQILYGSVSGVTKDGLVLKNGGSTTSVVTPYTTFQFSNNVNTDDQFDIQVDSTPSNVEKCVVNNGKARANYYTVAQISVTCTIKTHAFSVLVQGLTSTGLVIANGPDNKAVTANGSVALSNVYEDGPYGVTVLTQPSGQTCTVSGGGNGKGGGTMGSTDLIDNVLVTCA